jgi:hypothetical protein
MYIYFFNEKKKKKTEIDCLRVIYALQFQLIKQNRIKEATILMDYMYTTNYY